MGENINQIEREIVAERHELRRNLSELETKAREFADWRTYYRNNPKLVLGIALSGGLVLGAISRRSRNSGYSTEDVAYETAISLPRLSGRASRHLDETWQGISDALMAVASAKVVEFVGNVVPGFREQLRRRQSASGNAQLSSR